MAKRGSTFAKYDPAFKREVVEAYLSGRFGGYGLVAKHFGLKSICQVYEWTDRYRKEGPDSLSKDMRSDGKETMRGKYFQEKNIEDWPLERQIEYLKMENAILKKAKALRLKNSGERNDT